jgi:Cch helix turn helix domain
VNYFSATAQGEEGLRLASYAAAITVAGNLAHRALGLPWEFQSPFLVGDLWAEVVGAAHDATDDLKALEFVVSWARANQHRFHGRGLDTPSGGWAGRWDEESASPVPATIGGVGAAVKSEGDGEGSDVRGTLIFYTHVLEGLLQDKKYVPDAVLRAWRERGWLATDADRSRLTKRVRVKGDRPHCYVVTRAAIDEADGASGAASGDASGDAS